MERKTLTREQIVDFTVRAVCNFFAELFGVATYMFVGCLCCVIGIRATLDAAGVALAFSFAIMIGVEISLQISGAHLNPILTVTAMFFRKVSIPMGIVYIVAHFCGSLLGFGLVKALTPKKYFSAGLCSTIPNPDIHIAQALFVEFAASSVLVLMVCAQWHPRNTRLETISIRIGFTLFSLLVATVPFSGGGLNPARALGPAIWNNVWKDHWIYWLGPSAATVIWSPIYYKIFVELAPQEKEEE